MKMYRFVQWLKKTFPFLWDIIEWVNSCLFALRYGKKLCKIDDILTGFQGDYVVREARSDDLDGIVTFFKEQPEESFTFFRPHSFDSQMIKRLINRTSYLFFLILKDDIIVGYFFLRCFVQGKCFRGKIVDYRWRGRGIAKLMGLASTEIAQALGLRMFGTISKENISSMASSAAVNEIKIIENLPNDYVYIEYLPKNNDGS